MDESYEKTLCRLCGIKLENSDALNIFEDSSNLSERINQLLQIMISPDDKFSKCICSTCYNKVNVLHSFSNLCLSYEKQLHTTAKTEELNNVEENSPDGCESNLQISLANVEDLTTTNDIVKDYQERFQEYGSVNGSEETVEGIAKVNSRKRELITSDITVEESNNDEAINTVVEIDQKSIQEHCKSSKRMRYKKNTLQVLPAEPNFAENDVNSSSVLKQESADEMQLELTSFDQSHDQVQQIINTTEENDELIDANLIDDSVVSKFDSKLTCDLCGTRYVSQLKYEFHMERHKRGCIDNFTCPLCGKESGTEKLLWNHYFYIHKCAQRYVCKTCDRMYTRLSKLKLHQDKFNHEGITEISVNRDTNDIVSESKKVLEGVTSANCVLCGSLVTDLDPEAINDAVSCTACEDYAFSLMVHTGGKEVVSRREYRCSQCSKSFGRKDRLEFHEMRHNEDMNEFVCSSCGKEFSTEHALYEHYLFVHKQARPHMCELCGKSFQLKARLKDHLRSHTGERPFQCDVCGQRYATNSALKLHKKTHIAFRHFTCQICNKTYRKKQNMNEHLERHWRNDSSIFLPQAFICPFCSEGLPTYRTLKFHMMEMHRVEKGDPILSDQKPWYECEICHEKFKHQMSLKAHRERIHEGKVNPLFQCDICNVTYKVKQRLENHIKNKHIGERRYKCAQCGKGFCETKSLHSHVLLHTGAKPYMCKYCGMSFRRKDSQDQHHKKHAEEQLYKCKVCEETFCTMNDRSKHMKQEHEKADSSFACPDCGEQCSGQREIRIHLNMHLGEKLQKLQES
ncbi:zinc finger protein 502 isoform X2 [Orussus abietinus]|uniref:zinc finger protein 502 isoform X2 n=1 Tax=Orussus abietinus TaxID=222816 RepID=UPI00062550E9|nr:zinc finger protein 502 isoform X2 [Orussus abietinus]